VDLVPQPGPDESPRCVRGLNACLFHELDGLLEVVSVGVGREGLRNQPGTLLHPCPPHGSGPDQLAVGADRT